MTNKEIYQIITNPDSDHRLRSVAFRLFFKNNQDQFKKTNSGYGQQTADLQEDEDVKLTWTWGRCFPSAQFTFYALGGYAQTRYQLMCSRKNQFDLNGHEITTSHWFVKDTVLDVVIDPTSTQFFNLTFGEFDIEDELPIYNQIIANGKRANFGFPYYKVNGRKIDFGCTVPSKEVLRFYSIFRKEYGILPGLEPFYVVATSNI